MSNLSNAIGTQQQFTPRPRDTYEKRLVHPTINTYESNSGMMLAKSLGVLSDALNIEALSGEKRKEKIGIYEAERIMAGRTEDDIRKLNAIEMLNTHGEYRISDNPYAVTTIEKMRGKYLGSRVKTEYELDVVANQGRMKTPEEEVQRYNKYIHDKYQALGTNTTDNEAFSKGYFENHIFDQLDVANKQINYKSSELETDRKITTNAELSKIIDTSYTSKPEDITAKFNETMAHNRMAGATRGERIEQTKIFLKNLTDQTGDATQLEHLIENGIIGVDDKGTNIKIGDVIDAQPFKRNAESRTRQLHEVRIQSDLKRLSESSPAIINSQYDEWKAKDPTYFNVMVPYRDNLLNQQEQMERRKQMKEAKQKATQFADEKAFSIYENQYKAYGAGNNKDVMGYNVATTFGELPEFSYETIESDGSVATKKYSHSHETFNRFIDKKIYDITSRIDLPIEEKARQTMKILQWGAANHTSNSIKMQIGNTMDTLTIDKLKTDPNGLVYLPENLNLGMEMYRTDHESFRNIMGETLTNEVETLQLLNQSTGGNLNEAVNLYALSKDKRKDPVFSKDVKGKVAIAAGQASFSGFFGIDGKEMKIDTSLISNYAITKRVTTLAENLVYAGYTVDNAIETSLKKAKETSYVYKDTAIPRSIFNSINTDEKARVGKAVLDYYVDRFTQETGVARDHITIDFDINRNRLKILGGGKMTAYSVNDITYSGNEFVKAWSEQPKQGSNMSYEDLQKQIEIRNDVEELRQQQLLP